jgi:ferredoxin
MTHSAHTRDTGIPHAAAPVPAAGGPVTVSVDNGRCGLYGVCQQEAPDVFELGPDGRLRYRAHPQPVDTDAVWQAARCCPLQAITVENRS